jgi:hypothetical protein
MNMASIRYRMFCRNFTAITLLMAGPLSIDPALAAGRVLSRCEYGHNFQGQVQKATIDRHGAAWIATDRQLFRVAHECKPVLVESSSSRDRLLALAPGGERYAWLDSRNAPYGQFAIELYDLNRPGTRIRELDSGELPRGFGALRFGLHAGSILGVTALQDPEGLRGKFRYTFWNRDGRFPSSIEVPGRRIRILDDSGQSLLLLGESSAELHQGKRLPTWTVPGSFRNGVLGTSGQSALLNPAQRVNEVHVVQSGGVTKVLKFQAPVHGLAITPDGSRGAVATGNGELTLIEMRARSVSVREPRRLSISSRYYVTAIRFVNRDSIAVGAIQYYGSSPFERFYAGAVQVLKITGSGPSQVERIFETSIRLPVPATWSPELDVTYGSDTFAAYTPEAAIVVKLR